ncbi:unnamed protein product [Symbiodinium natans]|uniref:Uncharacterized protein n=1 Tax=Symbiodinium natans TaxID=878477 RepID=A0A812H0L0_9DINO|nr:unnamed protein product [Symbiodinium natans]
MRVELVHQKALRWTRSRCCRRPLKQEMECAFDQLWHALYDVQSRQTAIETELQELLWVMDDYHTFKSMTVFEVEQLKSAELSLGRTLKAVGNIGVTGSCLGVDPQGLE